MTTHTVVAPGGRTGGPLLTVHAGPSILAHLESGPGLAAHESRVGRLERWGPADLLALLREVAVRGRGGAGFPFATKVEAALEAPRRPSVVVNVSEGEPASFKDAALALARPHLVLDGASMCARTLGARTAHVVVPTERPGVEDAVRRALAERRDRDGHLRWRLHRADPRFVAGQARAVIELLSGRANLPVTSWEPEARKGYRNRPTLLSNAETYAHVALAVALGSDHYLRHGTDSEPGTMLLTLNGTGPRPEVLEVAHGTAWTDVLDREVLDRPVLVGGYHGSWAAPGALADLAVSRAGMGEAGLALGAGVVLPLPPGECPVHRSAQITEYLATQSAGRCGPCLNGLPALSRAVWDVHHGHRTDRATELLRLVSRRGACAHPDGTARMVQSMLTSYAKEVEAHARGACQMASQGSGRSPHLVGSAR